MLQLINALDDDGNIIPFDDENEEIVMALSSQAAIAISNMRYRDELQEQMWSFTEAMAAAIDERTPYNASHTRNVAKYCGLVADHINELHAKGLEEESFSINRKEQLVMEPFFTEEEKECLRIVKGTLTEKERKIMESHVEITDRILSKVHFNSYFLDSPKWAAEHHECLNGRGYPNHKTADELATDARIIAVADICDALLATDRPYKKPIPKEKAYDILKDMANNGNIDGKIVEYLYDCIDC